MSGLVGWIAAVAEGRDTTGVSPSDSQVAGVQEGEARISEVSAGSASPGASLQELPAHALPADDFPQRGQVFDEARMGGAPNSYWDRDPDLWMYRKKTTSLLRRYMRWSLEAGRLPSLLGRELFRAKITAYTATTFEDRVIFIHDVERCLEQLASFDREIVARVVLQEHEHPQAARILHCTRRTIERRLPEVLDELSEAFLKARLLEPLPEVKEEAP